MEGADGISASVVGIELCSKGITYFHHTFTRPRSDTAWGVCTRAVFFSLLTKKGVEGD